MNTLTHILEMIDEAGLNTEEVFINSTPHAFMQYVDYLISCNETKDRVIKELTNKLTNELNKQLKGDVE